MAYAGSRPEGLDVAGAPFELAQFLPFRLERAAQSVSSLIAATCEARFGLNMPAWRVLCALAEAGALDLEDIGYRTALGPVAAAEATAGLALRGLIARAAGEAGFATTAAGLDAYGELAPVASAAEAALLAGLSPVEVATLHRLLARLHAAAEKLAGRPA